MKTNNNYKNKPTKKKLTPEQKKRARTINIIIYVIAALLLVFAGVLLLREFVLIPSQPYIDPNEVGAGLQTYEPLGTPVSDYDMIPVKLTFLSESVTCDIAPVGIDENNSMESIPDAHIAAWLSKDPYVIPGDVGNAVIGGHNLWKGQAGTFSLLKDLQLGDSIAVGFDTGDWRYFEVIDTYECSFDDTTCMQSDKDEPILTLVTCKGDWDSTMAMSRTRVIAVCKYVSAP